VETLFTTQCSLCKFDFGDQHATGSDITPYAKAFGRNEAGWRRMLDWVWFAGGERLKHLALMRASAASRRFARINVILLALGLALFQVSEVGWRQVTASRALESSGSTVPSGRGWLHLADMPRPLPTEQAPGIPVDLWWNPAQTIVAFVVTWVTAMLGLWLILTMLRGSVRLAHARTFREEQRMTAALHYGTSWCVPVLLGAVLGTLRPLAYAGKIEHWSWYVPERAFLLSAAVFAGFGVIMAWFWFIRIGSTAPANTRTRVVALWALGAPVAVAALAAGWWYGLGELFAPLFERLEIQF